MRIYNVHGKEVRKLSIVNYPFSISKGDLSSGVYFYKITSEEKNVAAGKLIIQ